MSYYYIFVYIVYITQFFNILDLISTSIDYYRDWDTY